MAASYLQQIEAGADAHRLQVVLHRLRPLAWLDIAGQLDVEAVGEARLGQELPGFGRVVIVEHRGRRVAAELRGVAGRRRHARPAGDELRRDSFPVYGVPDRLAHLQVGHRVAGAAAPRRVQLEVADSHRLLPHRLQVRQPVHVVELIRIHVPDPVHATGQQFGQLRRRVGHEARGQAADGGPALRAAGVVAVEPLVFDERRGVHARDPVGPGADGRARVAIRSHALAVALGPDPRDQSEVLQRRRRGSLQVQAHREVARFFRAVHPGVVAGGCDAAVGVRHRVQGVDHIVGAEIAAVVELHASAHFKVERCRIHPIPSGGERGNDPEAFRVAVHQPIPGLVAKNEACALAVEVRIDVGYRIAEHDPQHVCVALRSGPSRRDGRQGNARGCQALPEGASPDRHEVPPISRCGTVVTRQGGAQASALSRCGGDRPRPKLWRAEAVRKESSGPEPVPEVPS